MIKHYPLHQLIPYVNWTYFFFAWGIKGKFASVHDVMTAHDCPACRDGWINSYASDDERAEAREALRLYTEAHARLRQLEADGVQAHCLFHLFPAHSEGDNIVAIRPDGQRIVLPFMRQQHMLADRPNLCLSDFIAPEGYDDPHFVANRLGGFATTVDDVPGIDDPYDRMLVQTLLDRMAEAAAERWHEEIRKTLWGFAPHEKLTIKEMLAEQYQSIRPAVGYPSIPDQSFNFLLFDLIGMSDIGISLTENGMMIPHAAVSGLIFAHPQAQYFAIGPVSDEQLSDYARRRGTTLDDMRRFVPKQ